MCLLNNLCLPSKKKKKKKITITINKSLVLRFHDNVDGDTKAPKKEKYINVNKKLSYNLMNFTIFTHIYRKIKFFFGRGARRRLFELFVTSEMNTSSKQYLSTRLVGSTTTHKRFQHVFNLNRILC